MGVQVKICGNTTPGDARAAEAAGADLLGVVVEPPVETPRKVTLERARDIARSVSKPVVAVLVDPGLDFALRAADATSAWAVQLSGDEPLELVRKVTDHVRVFKAVHVAPDGRIRLPPGATEPGGYLRTLEDAADFLLLDTAVPGKAGGTGTTHDWSNARAMKELVGVPLILAGGLTPENVGRAVAEVGPWGVDVASGVEASPGRKDPARVREFIRRAKGRNL